MQEGGAATCNREGVARWPVAGGQVGIAIGQAIVGGVALTNRQIAKQPGVEIEQAAAGLTASGVGHAQRHDGIRHTGADGRCRRRKTDVDTIVGTARIDVLAIDAEDQLAAVVSLAREEVVEAQPRHAALADDAQRTTQGGRGARGVDAGVTIDKVDAIAQRIQWHPVAQRVQPDMYVGRTVGRGGERQRADMIAIEQVGMLDCKAGAQLARALGAGIVERYGKMYRAGVDDDDLRIDLVLGGAAGQRDFDLLGRIVVGQLNRL